jgi:hypothetical protein
MAYASPVAYARPVSPVNLSTSLAESVTIHHSQRRPKYYAIRRGRVAFPTIVQSWSDCSLLVNGFPNAEFRSFRLLADAEAYLSPEGPPDIAFLSLHHDEDHLPVLPVGGGVIAKANAKEDPKAFTFNANAPEWKPNPRPLTKVKQSSTFSNTNSEFKTTKNLYNQSGSTS